MNVMKEEKKYLRYSKNKIIANFLLILTTVLWGTTFIITKNLTKNVPIFLYLGLRFSLAIFGFLPNFNFTHIFY